MLERLKGKTPIIIAVVIGVLLLGGGAYSVYAATGQGTTGYPPIVEKLAKAFNLDPAKVDKVFQDDRQERQAQAKAHFEQKLDQAVKDGKITEAQKAAILKKQEELKTKFESLKDLSPEDRRAAMQKLRSDMQAWAKDNGLDKKPFMMFGLGRFMGGPKGFMHKPGGFGPEGFGPGGFMGGPGEFKGGPEGFPHEPESSTGNSGI